MLPYLLTTITGMVCGIVLMRLWQARSVAGTGGQPDQTSPESSDAPSTSPRSARLILIAAALIALVAIAIAAFRKDTPNSLTMLNAPASAPQGLGAPALADVDTMIAQLENRLKNAPDDGEGFRMLGWSYNSTGKPAKAVPAYERALILLPGRADVHAGYGEALVGVATGKVTAQAKRAFDKAISLDPKEPRARFFLSLYKAQNGQEKAALEEWIALANGGPANAPWQGDVRSRIQSLALKLGVDVADRLTPADAPASPMSAPMSAPAPAIAPGTMESAAALPPEQQRSMIDGMVEGLAAKLKNNPRNAEGWVRLLRSRMVLGQQAQAGRDLATARKALAGDSAGLGLVDAAARENGVPGN